MILYFSFDCLLDTLIKLIPYVPLPCQDPMWNWCLQHCWYHVQLLSLAGQYASNKVLFVLFSPRHLSNVGLAGEVGGCVMFYAAIGQSVQSSECKQDLNFFIKKYLCHILFAQTSRGVIVMVERSTLALHPALTPKCHYVAIHSRLWGRCCLGINFYLECLGPSLLTVSNKRWASLWDGERERRGNLIISLPWPSKP